MHVAVLSEGGDYLLCHIRQVSGEGESEAGWLSECFQGETPDYYRLFMHLHNNYHLPDK